LCEMIRVKWELTVMTYKVYDETSVWLDTADSDECNYADISINYRCKVLQWVSHVF